jgi:hypothetical protein
MAVDKDYLYLTADFFSPDKYLIYILEKAPMLSGGFGVSHHELITGSGQQSMGIPVTWDSDAPAQYIIQSTEYSSNNTVIFHAIRNPLTSYDRVTVTVNVEPYTYPASPPQKGSSVRPYLFEPRFWSCQEINGQIWAVHHVNSSRARIRWYQFDMNGWPESGFVPTVAQWGEIDAGDGISTYFGSIGVDWTGNAAITFARSSTSEYISMCRAVRSAGDPLGTFRDPEFVKLSTTPHTSGRWGDYSFTQPDPEFDSEVFWGHHEFCTSGGWSWRTWVGEYVVETMDLSNDPLVAGSYAELRVTGAAPGDTVYFAYSLTGPGTKHIPALDITMALDSPSLIGPAMADASGNASITGFVPVAGAGREVWLQAVAYQRVSDEEYNLIE